MPKYLHRLFYYTLLLGVYGIFFSVESFYNFEGHSDASSIISHSSRTTPLHSTAAHSIRLNKRFHQENIPPCPVLTPIRPEHELAPLVLGVYRPLHRPDPALLYRPLRGPPSLT